jgi:ATP-dependent RNA helicase DDX18/HAS1
MSQHYFLHKSAQEAYKGFVRAYASHKEKRLFDVEKLDLKGVAKSFGFSVPPFVDLSILLHCLLSFLCVRVVWVEKSFSIVCK